MAKAKTAKGAARATDEAPAAAAPLLTGSGAPAQAERTLEQAIGAQIRHYRKVNSLTVAELAATAGLSTGMLSKIENGQISPSLGTLQLIAGALNLPISHLFAGFEERRDSSYVKAGQGVVIQRRGTKVGHQYELIGHSLFGDVAVEPYLITLSEDAAPYTAFQHEGTEFIFMLSGEVVYALGDRGYHLSPGDALLFDSAAPHGPEKLIKTPMTYLSIIIYRRT